MPFNRLLFILVLVVVAAGATVALALTLTGALQIEPEMGLAALTLVALCASFLWRRTTKRHDQ